VEEMIKEHKTGFKLDDIVHLTGSYHTKTVAHWSVSGMDRYIGRKDLQISLISSNGFLKFVGIGWSFFYKDCELVHREEEQEWLAHIREMYSSIGCSHPLNYACYSSNMVNSKFSEWGEKKPISFPEGRGYCFQTFANDQNERHLDRLHWVFRLAPKLSPGTGDGQPDFKPPKPLPKTTIRWWFKQWMRLGVFPKGVTLKDLMNGILDMPIKYKPYGKTLPSNKIYLPVCIVRHVSEFSDCIKATRWLVEKRNVNFFTAISIAFLCLNQNRGHALFGTGVLPKMDENYNLAVRIAVHAKLIEQYFNVYIKEDKTRTIFQWWWQLKSLNGVYEFDKKTKSPKHKQWEKHYNYIIKNWNSCKDIINYNPEEEVLMNND
jgi:hypothetical protein